MSFLTKPGQELAAAKSRATSTVTTLLSAIFILTRPVA